MEWPLNIAYADAAFHCGAGRANGWVDDCEGWSPLAKGEQLNEMRMRHHMNRVQSKPSQVKYAEGWAVRVLRVRNLMGVK